MSVLEEEYVELGEAKNEKVKNKIKSTFILNAKMKTNTISVMRVIFYPQLKFSEKPIKTLKVKINKNLLGNLKKIFQGIKGVMLGPYEGIISEYYSRIPKTINRYFLLIKILDKVYIHPE